MKKFILSSILTAMIFSIYAQTQVGRTRYDLQTNSSNCRRVATNAAGEIVVTYTRSHQSATAYADRGTGYNYSSDNGTTWSETNFAGAFNRPDSARTGWPNIIYTDTKEIIISHFAGGNTSGMQVLSRDLGSNSAWNKQIVNSSNATNTGNASFADDATWFRAANKGDSIIAIFGLFDLDLPGMTGGLLMYRSSDGGATWTGPDNIPMMNSTNFVRNGGDNYSIDMNKNGKIAIVLGTYQVEVLTSTDFGDTFTKQTVVAVKEIDGVTPIPLFDSQIGETMDTVNTTDRSYSVIVDDNDMVHVWFGRTRSFKELASTSSTSYLPLTVGLVYWNDQMTEGQVIHESRIAAQQVGVPNPLYTQQVFSNSGFGDQVDAYRQSLTSMANASYDANGNIYVAYSSLVAVTLDDITDNSTANNISQDGFHFQDIYLLKSADNGATWEGPINVSNQPLKDCVYPGIPRKIEGTSIPIIWQQDDLPSLELQHPSGMNHPTVENEIMFKSIDISTIVTPTDITAPTVFENTTGVNTVTAYLNCDIEFHPTFNNDDVPTGPDVLDYQIVDATSLTSVGVHPIQIYVEDAAGNSSDTIDAVVTIVADNIDPTVNLIGPSALDVLVNTSYTDPGITYDDNACYPSLAPTFVDNVTPNIATPGTYTYEWTVTDNSGNTTTVTRNVTVISLDSVAPVITANGSLTETVEACGTYTDLGATAFDNIDFDLTNSINTVITLNGSPVAMVDPMVLGVYTITYTVSDAAGNIGTKVRTVTVADTQAPEITVTGVNLAQTMYVCKGDQSFVLPSATASDCISATLTNNASTVFDINTSGAVSVTYTAVDPSGNTSTKVLNLEVGEAPVATFVIDSIKTPQVWTSDESTLDPTNWLWTWGDNTTSFSADANHAYNSVGSYEICLKVTNNFSDKCANSAATEKTCKTVEITVGIKEVNLLNASLDIHPNPTNGLISVTLQQENLKDVKVGIYNLIGELIVEKLIDNTSKNNTVNFDLSENAKGIYFVNIETEKAVTSKKVILK